MTVGNIQLTYDGNGNLVSDGTNTYVWDARNRLTSISGPTPATFAYDPSGLRIAKNINGTTTQFQYGTGGLAQEFDGTQGNVLTDMGFSRLDTAGKMTFLTDQIGSTIALTDDGGTVQTQYSYEPFGRAVASGTSSTNPYQFLFHENDRTGVDYFGRYYSPTFQRFISEEAAALDNGANSYAYAAGRPIGDASLMPGNPDLFAGNGGSGESCEACGAALLFHQAVIVPSLLAQKFHFFWATSENGDLRTDSGELSPSGYLDHEQDYPYDYPYNGRHSVFSVKASTAMCPYVSSIRRIANSWRNETSRYGPYPGPNSNTVAAVDYFRSGITAIGCPSPPNIDAPGWNMGFTFVQ